MTKRMLIDAAHSEEVRVVVLDDDRIEDFEVETSGKEQIKGNIYVAEVTRVEPSLQAAFVNYGGNRNGFLAFSEIHPAYFSLPEEEKQALLDELSEIANRRKGRDQEIEAKMEEDALKKSSKADHDTLAPTAPEAEGEELEVEAEAVVVDSEVEIKEVDAEAASRQPKKLKTKAMSEMPESLSGLTPEEMEEDARALAIASAMIVDENAAPVVEEIIASEEGVSKKRGRTSKKPRRHTKGSKESEESSESTEKEASAEGTSSSEAETEEAAERRQPIHRRYSIGDVVKEGQKILIQVNKEERGNKGAAVSTYISLPGRYSVLMPNTPYAGGISRKITDFSVRREIKTIMSELKVPENMGVIIRTAGVGQECESIEKDLNNMLSLWKKIEGDYASTKKAPYVVHEDGSLAVRAIRDMFSEEIEEVQISDRKTYRLVKDYMKSLMPENAKKVKEYKLSTPVFTHYGVEDKLNRLHTTRVNLPSGGYLIINPTEALVSVDVNSGKATQEKNIEETALKTNLEAAEEVARQLRLRDLAGLIVVDFIDMEETRHERAVEKVMRKAVRRDRARIQIAPISTFGLMEMSRQRLRPSLGESTMQPCSHCNGTGWVPSLASAALTLLRSLEDENIRTKAERVIITTSDELALYVLNHKREMLKEIEERYSFSIYIRGDNNYHAPDHRIEIVRKDSRGTEKRQILEVILREPLDSDDSNKKNRRKGRKEKGENSNGKREKHEHKHEHKHARHENEHEKASDDAEPSAEVSANGEASEGEAASDERKGRRNGRSRHLRRGGRRERGEREENSAEKSAEGSQTSSENGVAEEKTASSEGEGEHKKGRRDHNRNRRDRNSRRENFRENTSEKAEKSASSEVRDVKEDKGENQAKPATASAREEKAEKPIARKGIVVEQIGENGEKLAAVEDSSVKKKFQRWWKGSDK